MKRISNRELIHKILLLLLFTCGATGCLSPNLCDTAKSIDKEVGLSPEHLRYFENKPNLSVAESHITLFPVAHKREYLQKRSSIYKYVTHTSLLGGLILEKKTTRYYDVEGKPIKRHSKDTPFSIFSGLLFESEMSLDTNMVTGASYKSFLLKAFGSAQEARGSKYYTVFWMPMKFGKQTYESDPQTPMEKKTEALLKETKALTDRYTEALEPSRPTPPDMTLLMEQIKVIAAISQSHIDGNVPSPDKIDEFLQRDLISYFSNMKGTNVSVEYEQLRSGPTQVGIGYPKYYLWVTIKNGVSTLESGAVYLAAIDKKRFEVFEYIPAAQISADPSILDAKFPAALHDKILKLANVIIP